MTPQQPSHLSEQAMSRIVVLRQAALDSIDATREALQRTARTEAARQAASSYRSLNVPLPDHQVTDQVADMSDPDEWRIAGYKRAKTNKAA
jgi:hypothetical protein